MGDRSWMHDEDDRPGPTRGLVGLTSWLDRNFGKTIITVVVLGVLLVTVAVLAG